MQKLTLEQYKSMEPAVRKALRRKAFGHPNPLPPQLEGQFDLEHLRTILVQENERTGWFPEPWDPEQEEIDELVRR